MKLAAPLLLAIALAAVPAGAVAQQRRAPNPAPALIRLENAWATALVHRDAATFQRLLAPRFIYTENDRLMTRDDVIRGVMAPGDTVVEAHNEDMAVHAFGANVAIVTGWLVVRGRDASGAYVHRYRFTDSWLRRDGRWQIVAAQDYLAPASAQ